MTTYMLDSFGRVLKQTMPTIDYSEDNTNLCATFEYIKDDGIKRLLLENKKIRDLKEQIFKLQREKEWLYEWHDVNKYSMPNDKQILVRCKNKNKEDGIWLYDLVEVCCGVATGRNNWEDITHWKYID